MTRQITPHTAVDPSFVERWSPRAFEPVDMPKADLMTLFEAARWAPSAFNSQPWRFIWSRRGDPNWELFLSLLIPFNADWAKNSSVLGFVVSRTRQSKPDGTSTALVSHAYDAGSAWMQLALQAMKLGYHAHGMTGIDFDEVRTKLRVPEEFEVNAAFAVGKLGSPDSLPQKLRDRETPSDRLPLDEICSMGFFDASNQW
ncbi:nitroreductase family protein [Henriciella sp. AS95]|uniref:nitroreductase family protein n=1 Tax=Henriciella sp. AS95 TaxID=3135782 RepID=UPI00317717B0